MGKILITGNPSSGTTFTVGLLTLLGYDTGYSELEVRDNFAGLEIMAGDRSKRKYRRMKWNEKGIDISPKVIKHPFNLEEAPRLIKWADQLGWKVDRVILLFRAIDEILEKRPRFNVERHDRQLSQFLLEAAKCEWPVNLLAYPRIILDVDYCYRAFKPLTDDFDFDKFKKIWIKYNKQER